VESDISSSLRLVDVVSVIKDPTDDILLGEELFKELADLVVRREAFGVDGVTFVGFDILVLEEFIVDLCYFTRESHWGFLFWPEV
jgi:hypothetical protein